MTVSPGPVIVTDATGIGRTTRCIVAPLPSLTAARMTSPGLTAVTQPVWAIVATPGLEMLQSMVRSGRILPWESWGNATSSVVWVGSSTVSPTTEILTDATASGPVEPSPPQLNAATTRVQRTRRSMRHIAQNLAPAAGRRKSQYRIARPYAKLGAYRHRSSVVELSIRNPARPASVGAGRWACKRGRGHALWTRPTVPRSWLTAPDQSRVKLCP